ncbi:hypothetical protein [Marinomonas sp.]|uniref:hypothetical protein n=1 Tax=Marinomonas sp. TaxID=1904862 RepID=UPI003BAC45F6
MHLSQYLNIKKTSFFTIHGSSVLFLLLLQMAAWYPFLSDARDALKSQSRQKYQAAQRWEKAQIQAKQLEFIQFEAAPWAQHRVLATDQNVPTQWLLEGVASISKWQGLLEEIERQFALDLLSVSWRREQSGNWQGSLLFAVKAPKGNREFHNWLPTRLRAERFVLNDWQLLSTMRIGEITSALIIYKDGRHWVRQGSWLAEAGLTVSSVSFDQVVLLAIDGSQQTLLVREQGGSNE